MMLGGAQVRQGLRKQQRQVAAATRSRVTTAFERRSVKANRGRAGRAVAPAANVMDAREMSEAAGETPAAPVVQGMGAAVIHAHYDRLGINVGTPSFLNVPKTVSVIGAPMSWGQPRAGTDQGAAILRESGLESTLLGLEWRIDDQGDLEFDGPSRNDPPLRSGKAKNHYVVGQGLKKIHDKVHEAAAGGEFALILGGDHSISAGTVSAVLRERPNTGIIWVDAHGDLNTPESSPSGNMHGMPLGLLLGLVDPTSIPGWEWFKDVPTLKPEQLVFVGLRDLDEPERKVILENNIKAFTMMHVDHYGIGRVMDMALEHLRLPDGSMRPLHLSYDIDAVDPELAPSTGTVVRGGFNFREAHYIAEAVSATNMLGSMDLVEVNPKLTAGPESEMTASLGMALIASAMGSRIL